MKTTELFENGISIGRILIEIVIFAKVTLIIGFFIMGIRAHQARSGKATFVVYLMCIYILVMIGLAL